MPALLNNIDPDGLLEFSVVYTDRALNHMSQRFQGVMRDISGMLKEVYNAHSVALVPGSGTFGMEAVARQFASRQKVLVVRNGWFSYRWTQIFEMGQIPAQEIVMKARPASAAPEAPWSPCPVEEVVAAILRAALRGDVRTSEALMASTGDWADQPVRLRLVKALAYDRALRRSDIGGLSVGMRADFVVLDAPNYFHLTYRPGVDLVDSTWVAGTSIYQR